jgi:hypothetical protein
MRQSFLSRCDRVSLVAAIATFLVATAFTFGLSPRQLLRRFSGDPVVVLEKKGSVGEGYPGDVRTAVFQIHNDSNTRVEIVGGRAPCSCVDLRFLPVTIQPHATYPLPITHTFQTEWGAFHLPIKLYVYADERLRMIDLELVGRTAERETNARRIEPSARLDRSGLQSANM